MPVNKRTKSPTKAKSTIATGKAGAATINVSSLMIEQVTSFNIIKELNNEDIEKQDCQIENERLKTTCYTLNNKVAIVEDIQHENETLKRRLAESEEMRQKQQEEIADYEKNRESYEKNRLLQEQVIADLQKNRLEYEETRLQNKAQLDKLIDENKSIRKDQEDLLVMKQKMQQ